VEAGRGSSGGNTSIGTIFAGTSLILGGVSTSILNIALDCTRPQESPRDDVIKIVSHHYFWEKGQVSTFLALPSRPSLPTSD
jgi:hypothetical protein